MLFSIDAHAAGGACRTVHAGLPALGGADAQERRQFFRHQMDWVRLCLMHEPRGHSGQFGALLGPPVRPTSAFSLIFFDPSGYLDGCGHGTLCSVAAWQRMLGAVRTPMEIDNPDGSITRVLSVSGNGDWCESTLLLPSASILERELPVLWGGGIRAAKVRCGNVYVLIDAAELGAAGNALFDGEADAALLLRELLDAIVRHRPTPAHELPEVLVYRCTAPDEFDTSVLFSGSQVDRSPCGTGSGALACLLHDRGSLAAGRSITTRGPARLPFEVAVERAHDNTFDVRLTGRAYITGVHEWIVSGDDPLGLNQVADERAHAAD